ncbi:hypothetical protein QYF36_024832 [Acer negundo]|nr:hypothetical protein QYF36_024832 [Acer negundo]
MMSSSSYLILLAFNAYHFISAGARMLDGLNMIIFVCGWHQQWTASSHDHFKAVEVRTLTPTMYSQVDVNCGLILRRVAFGTKDIVKYPEDNYDRIWFPAINSGIFTEATSSAIIANTLDNDPPKEVLRNAFITQNTSTAIVLRANLLMNMYFSEVDVLDSTDERSFEFYINDVIVSDPIIPPYGKAIQRYLKNFSASSNTSFALGATSNSTLPPLTNALEVFTITDQLTDGTSPYDG